jgi:opacity protein-like surface antigen
MTHASNRSLSRSARTLLAAAVLLGGAQWASAQSSPMPMMGSGTNYIGLSGGPSDFSRSRGGFGLFNNGDHDTAYSLMAGNYFINPNVGMELGYTNFGSVPRGGGNTKAEGINISLIGKLPVGSSLNLLGKLGTTYGHTEVSSNPASGIQSGSESGFDWSYGVGAELVITPQWSAVLQYDEHYLKFAGSSSERVTTTTIGARMHF